MGCVLLVCGGDCLFVGVFVIVVGLFVLFICWFDIGGVVWCCVAVLL